MTQFNQGWWNCFTSFANNTRIDYNSVCMEVLRGAGIKRNEAEYAIKKQYVYGEAVGIIEEYLKLEE